MGQQIEALALFVAATRWQDAPAPVQTRVKFALLDMVGVMLAGSLRPEVQGLRTNLIASGGIGATVLAPGMPATDPRTAALLNAIAGRSVELCDGLRGVQPSVQIVPGILAAGEARNSSGEELLAAFLLGYEVAGRLGSGFTPRVFAHPNGQIALLACAAAGARLCGLDGPGISRSMRIAATMLMAPSYTNTAVGGTALNLPAGQSAVAAVLAPALALAGYVVEDDAIEHALGNMVGAGFDPAGITQGLGTDWQIAGSYFRFYACCNPIHTALDCLRDVLDALRPEPAAIQRIDVQTYAFASVMRNAYPPNYFASKYSLPHAAAVLAVRGGLGFAQLDDSALTDPVISALRQKVHVLEDPAMTARIPAARPALVSLTLHDGRQASANREMSWRDEAQPDPEPDLRAKFQELASLVLTSEGVGAVERAIGRAEDWTSVADLTSLLRRHSGT
jgi:2-methylcitrate dehydratase PrpD